MLVSPRYAVFVSPNFVFWNLIFIVTVLSGEQEEMKSWEPHLISGVSLRTPPCLSLGWGQRECTAYKKGPSSDTNSVGHLNKDFQLPALWAIKFCLEIVHKSSLRHFGRADPHMQRSPYILEKADFTILSNGLDWLLNCCSNVVALLFSRTLEKQKCYITIK